MTYWVELSLLHSGDDAMIDRLVETVDRKHHGQVVFTSAGPTVTLALVDDSPEHVEQIICRVVGLVRASAVEIGFTTLGWPEPVRIGDVRATPLEDDAYAAVAAASLK